MPRLICPVISLCRCLVLAGLLCTIQYCLVAQELAGADWPVFLGPAGDNTSTETGLLNKWSTNGPPILWEKEIGSGYGAPSVMGERLVLHHRLGEEEVVQCLEAKTGNPLWRYAYPSGFGDPFGYNNGPRCTPILTSNRCYTFGA